MQLTKDQWKSVEQSLSPPWGRTKLMIDNYMVELILFANKGKLSFSIMVCINGKFDYNWIPDKTHEVEDIRKRFFRPSKICAFRATKSTIKKCGKAFVKEMKKKYTGIVYLPYWDSFNSLKKHLVANNSNFEIIEPGNEVPLIIDEVSS